ncbi:MAG: hypothetical protein RSA00_02480, partial [Hydrogenoanaerobacterium sp.]
MGVFEILLVDHNMRRLIADRAPQEAILAAARKDGFVFLGDNCRSLVLEGAISAAEAARVISSTME